MNDSLKSAGEVRLDESVVIVTGGGRGLGRAIVGGLADSGATVLATMTAARPVEPPRGVEFVVADVRDGDSCARLVHDAVERFGRLDAVINNAALGMVFVRAQACNFWELSSTAWKDMFEVNLLGPFQLVRQAVPVMLQQGRGRIINVTTSLPTMIKPGFTPYGPLKAALEAATAAWASELEGSGITVNAILPGGPSRTDMILRDPTFTMAPDRLLEPAIVVPPCLWLLGPHAGAVTGSRIEASRWPCRPVSIRLLNQSANLHSQHESQPADRHRCSSWSRR